jgi:hypothetical protein
MATVRPSDCWTSEWSRVGKSNTINLLHKYQFRITGSVAPSSKLRFFSSSAVQSDMPTLRDPEKRWLYGDKRREGGAGCHSLPVDIFHRLWRSIWWQWCEEERLLNVSAYIIFTLYLTNFYGNDECWLFSWEEKMFWFRCWPHFSLVYPFYSHWQHTVNRVGNIHYQFQKRFAKFRKYFFVVVCPEIVYTEVLETFVTSLKSRWQVWNWVEN